MAKAKHKAKIDVSISALSKARSVYAERGDVNSCGDWLAEALKVFRTEAGSFDLTAFKACLKENEIEAPKVDENKHGWRGRFRMCAGLMLRRHAAKLGFVVIGDKKITSPGVKKRGRKTRQQKRVPVRTVPQDDCRSSVICGIHAQRSKSK
jgi:hypothetical protein